jgi:hypothetical protein
MCCSKHSFTENILGRASFSYAATAKRICGLSSMRITLPYLDIEKFAWTSMIPNYYLDFKKAYILGRR